MSNEGRVKFKVKDDKAETLSPRIIHSGPRDNVPQTCVLKTEVIFSVLEAKALRSRGPQGWFLLRPLCLLAALAHILLVVFPLHMSESQFPLPLKTAVILNEDPPQQSHFQNALFKTQSLSSHALRPWGL